MSYDYDLFVIGGGSGGVRAARVAAGQYGARVAIAEESRYGGTCVIRGCVPKKLMVYASEFSELAAEARGYGWDMPTGDFSWPTFHGKLNSELNRLEGIYRNLLDGSGVERFDHRAKVVGPHTVELADGTQKTAQTILIAVGGWPVKPDIVGAEHTITSNEIFHLPQLPRKILFVGGGYIACEFASVMNGLGVETTQVYRGEQILRGFDREVRDFVANHMCLRGVDLRTGVNVERIEKTQDGLTAHFTDGTHGQYDQIMMATGRAANTHGLGLDEVGVTMRANGSVEVDRYGATNIPSIYAVGDVTDRVQLTPVAIREAMCFVQTVFGQTPTSPDHDLIPTAIFTQPEIGTIGLSEEAAAAQGAIHVYATSFRPMRSLFAGKEEKVMMKLIVCATSDRVLGCHIVAPNAGEMIQLAGIAVKMGATKADFDRTVAVHPTMSEELVTLKEPVRST